MKPVSFSEMSIVQISENAKDVKTVEQEGRTFGYTLNKKRAKAKLLKGAKRNQNLYAELRPGCVNLRFNNGAYYEIVMPLLREWNQKCDQTVNINNVEVKIIEVEIGTENSSNHIDTKLILMVNDDRIVLHAYNGTQNLMVQGKNYENFALNVLEPFFSKKIEPKIEKITKFNNDVIDTLGAASSLKMKTKSSCPQCDTVTETKADLKIHMKTCHTKPGLSSPKRNKMIKVNNVKGAITNESEMKMIELAETDIVEDKKSIEKKDSPKKLLFVQQPVMEDLHSCYYCDFDAEIRGELDKHIKTIHAINFVAEYEQNSVKEEAVEAVNTVEDKVSNDNEEVNKVTDNDLECTSCSLFFKDDSEFKDHIRSHKKIYTVECGKCEKSFNTDLEHEWHNETVHGQEKFNCKKCRYHFQTENDLNIHFQSTHMLTKVAIGPNDQKLVKCDTCEYKCKLNIQLKNHKKQKHMGDSTKHSCSCKEYVKQEMVSMRKEVKEAFENFADLIGEVLGSKDKVNNENIKTLAETVHKLGERYKKIENKNKHKIQEMKIKDLDKTEASKTNIVPPKSYSAAVTGSIPASSSSQEQTKSSSVSTSSHSRRTKSTYLSKPKALYVTDSMGSSLSLREIEVQQNCRIKSERAYSSVYSRNAKWPKQNYTDVVKSRLQNSGRDQFEILIMSAPTVDITNLDGNMNQTAENKNKLEDEARLSSQNMFRLAERSLDENPSLKKVVIMEHPPRFDLPDVDPHSVKPNLAKLANIHLGQLWLNSSMKEKIFIGRHSLESPGAGAAHFRRYQSSFTGRYDGVHLYGQTGHTDYTNSVKTILSLALPISQPNYLAPKFVKTKVKVDDHTNCPQALYQRHQSVQVKNRFDVLSQGNF